MLSILLKGFLTGLALIIPIGPQNAFVLRQGILRNYFLTTALICSLFDCLFFSLGIASVGKIIGTSPILFEFTRWIGILFLAYLAINTFLRLIKSRKQSFDFNDLKKPSFIATILTVSALTLFNPHVYIDSFVLIGSLGASFGDGKFIFGLGVILASFFWFFTLAITGSKLSFLFKNQIAWLILDAIIILILSWIIWTLFVLKHSCVN